MVDANDIEQIRKWKGLRRGKFARYLGVNASTLWRWRQDGVPDGPAALLLERLKTDMIAERNRPNPWDNLGKKN